MSNYSIPSLTVKFIWLQCASKIFLAEFLYGSNCSGRLRLRAHVVQRYFEALRTKVMG
jgi:hypothetical protein